MCLLTFSFVYPQKKNITDLGEFEVSYFNTLQSIKTIKDINKLKVYYTNTTKESDIWLDLGNLLQEVLPFYKEANSMWLEDVFDNWYDSVKVYFEHLDMPKITESNFEYNLYSLVQLKEFQKTFIKYFHYAFGEHSIKLIPSWVDFSIDATKIKSPKLNVECYGSVGKTRLWSDLVKTSDGSWKLK